MNMLALLLAASLVVQEAEQSPPTQLPDVTVTAQRNVDTARRFVSRVAAPAPRRGLARWRSVCAAVANLHRDVAQPIADRLGNRAVDLGIKVEGPGCDANLIVIFSADARSVAQALVRADPDVFRPGTSGTDRGAAALRDFQDTDRPVRWWTLSIPINSDTGRRAVRAPGDPTGGPMPPRIAAVLGCDQPADCAVAPIVQTNVSSRLNSQVVDQIYKSIVIVDIDDVIGLGADQLGDYLAMVTLAQIDPQADTAAFDTVLNLFSQPDQIAGLSEWDRSYLWALYNSRSRRSHANAQAEAVAALMNRAPADD
ncbi:hypothetical protein ACO2Q1_01040 [Brevundimonas sp. VNH65]|uniref:hypothetical protein n=1 Tax=Brevundimonas sp. VNH65 TaxID=3400917 RepID=UPI003C00BCA8